MNKNCPHCKSELLVRRLLPVNNWDGRVPYSNNMVDVEVTCHHCGFVKIIKHGMYHFAGVYVEDYK